MKTELLIGQKAHITSRIVAAILVLISFAFSMFCVMDYIINNALIDLTSMVNFAGVVFISVFALFEIVVLLKNIKKELVIINILFNKDDTINRLGIIVCNIFLFIGLSLSILGICIYFIKYNDISLKYVGNTIFDIGFFTLVNCFIYDYLLIYFLNIRKTLY